MITVATRTKEGVPALYRVDVPTWEAARDFLKQELGELPVVLVSVKPWGEPCPT